MNDGGQSGRPFGEAALAAANVANASLVFTLFHFLVTVMSHRSVFGAVLDEPLTLCVCVCFSTWAAVYYYGGQFVFFYDCARKLLK